jgi:hypothetical protein
MDPIIISPLLTTVSGIGDIHHINAMSQKPKRLGGKRMFGLIFDDKIVARFVGNNPNQAASKAATYIRNNDPQICLDQGTLFEIVEIETSKKYFYKMKKTIIEIEKEKKEEIEK